MSNNAVHVIAIAKSKAMLLSKDYTPLDLPLWKRQFRTSAKEYTTPNELCDFLVRGQYISRSPNPVIVVDCTASDEIAQCYPRILDNRVRGVNIATPNKRAFSSSWQMWEDTMLAARNGGMLYFEATVGAGLPIISTLKDLLATGDTVTKIEGIFSGTLSYIFNVFGAGEGKFSEVVKEAKENGYTEPDPRDDLNGMDVARKLTILSRMVKVEFEGPPDGFPIESLIPKALEGVKSGDEFMAGLPSHDKEFDTLRAEAKSKGQVLRYVGRVDVVTKTVKVGLDRYISRTAYLGIPRHIRLHRFRGPTISLHSIPSDTAIDH
jgi:homoserine dehydrogenase